MRILASADVHGSQPVYEWLLNVARERAVDAIVLAGDLFGCIEGFDTPEQSQRHEATLLTASLRTTGVPVLYIMGNDDLVELNPGPGRIQSPRTRVDWRRVKYCEQVLRRNFLRGLFAGLRVVWPILSGLLALMIALGMVIGLREGWSIQESVYFAFVSGLTIGYGDLVPKTLLTRTLAMGIGVCGILLTALLAAVAVKALTAATEEQQ